MNHEEVRRNLAEGIDLDRVSATGSAIKEHLQVCAECWEYLSSLRRTIKCYTSYDVNMPRKAHELLEKALDNLSKK